MNPLAPITTAEAGLPSTQPPQRLPALPESAMTEAQRAAAQALIAGPRGGVFGPFIPLLRSPELMDRLQRVGEYLRFGSGLPARQRELLILLVARHQTNQFEWATHVPLAIKEGVPVQALDQLALGLRPPVLEDADELVWDVATELLTRHQLSDTTYARALAAWGESVLIDALSVVGYFSTVHWVMNVAGTPAPEGTLIPPLAPLSSLG